ncbi:S-Ena type endospore appendage [Bacillus cereus]|uniref:Endospore appendages core domain-containing protein n=1 Tax=Bacillus cereus HuA2-1 TaxID=1053201 RepID=J9C937_BACCE|nr:hypothetical protein IG3_03464 [Bacillus cereus HuA2-1]
MCNSGCNACCPPPQIFQEKICGNYVGTGAAVPYWTAPPGGYFSGTFEIFNSSASTGTTTATTISNPPGTLSAAPGNSDSQSVNNPTNFSITANPGDTGTFCIILYKRIAA